MTLRIAMWSGPRNLSTAMMRAFGARDDCAVWDEPFYGAFLKVSGIDHPMRDAVMADMETDWRKVARACAQSRDPAPVHYQKHMCHHMIPPMTLDFARDMTNVFLIRHPERVLASYTRKREAVAMADIGYAMQAELFRATADRLGHAPPVIDSEDVRQDPERVLRALCAALDLPFQAGMLSWPPGRRATDGVWAAHWYDAVERSTGFAPPAGPPPDMPDALKPLAAAARPYYAELAAHRLGRAETG